MSELKGHFTITDRAMRELECDVFEAGIGFSGLSHNGVNFGRVPGHNLPNFWMLVSATGDLIRGLDVPDVAWGAIVRDVRDVWSSGHWDSKSQKHHFMRRFDGQSPKAAYDDAIDWIYANAARAEKELAARLDRAFKYGGGRRPSSCRSGRTPSLGLRGESLFRGGVAEWIGNAVHATQDSFSPSHVRRSGIDPLSPGKIDHLFAYEGSEAEGHSDEDERWLDGDMADGLSMLGRWATNATKALFRCVVDAAIRRALGSHSSFWTFPDFVEHFLAPGNLSTSWNLQDQFIERYVERYGFGIMEMDEEKLANDLLRQYGTGAGFTIKVFERLWDNHNVDSDDVAVYWVEGVQKPWNSAAQAMLRANADLIHYLHKLLRDGVVMPDERAALKYLEGLLPKPGNP